MNITNEAIRDLAIFSVESFLNSQTPLNDSLLKKAHEMDLNSDQLKRAVEATNQICYLKMLKTASDRTFEFPLADHSVIITRMFTPESSDSFEKVASVKGPLRTPPSPLDFFEDFVEMEKVATEGTDVFSGDALEANLSLLQNSYFHMGEVLEKMAEEEEVFFIKLKAQAEKFSQEPDSLEKLAQACSYNKNLFLPLATLCGFDLRMEKKAGSESHPLATKNNSPKKDSFFFSRDLEKAAALINSLNEGRALISARKELESQVEKIAGILGTIGRGLGIIGGTIRNAEGKIIKPTVKPPITRSKSLTQLASVEKTAEEIPPAPHILGKGAKRFAGGVSQTIGKGYGYAAAAPAATVMGGAARAAKGLWDNKKSLVNLTKNHGPLLADAMYMNKPGRGVWETLHG